MILERSVSTRCRVVYFPPWSANIYLFRFVTKVSVGSGDRFSKGPRIVVVILFLFFSHKCVV